MSLSYWSYHQDLLLFFPLWHSWLHLTPSSCSSSSNRCHKSTVWCARKFLFRYFLCYGLRRHCHCGYAMTVSYDCDVLVPSGCTFRFKSSFCFINSCTLAVSVWICWAITTKSNGAVVVESIDSKELSQ